MDAGFDQEMRRRLEALRAQGLGRELRRVDSPQGPRIEIGGRPLLNFSSNDYLGLADDPALKEAAFRAIERYGGGAGASRLICGSLAIHHELEEQLAAYKATEAALSFSSGYATALGAIGALADKDAVVIVDKLAHACIVDAARLSGATLRVFAHNDLDDLERILRWAGEKRAAGSAHGAPSALIVTESVFSMDGDQAPLRELVALKERYGAWLMVDEAHATGLYGNHGCGFVQAQGVGGRVEVQMGTLGKAIGAAGGFIAGSRALIDYLVNRARTFIFSTAPAPAAVGAALAGLRLAASPEGDSRRERLWERARQLTHGNSPSAATPAAIVPIVIGDETRTVETAAALRERGFFIPAIRYPTVARGRARLRITLTASHTADQVAELREALGACGLPIP